LVNFRVVPTEFISDGKLLKGNFLVPEGERSFPGICKFHGLPGSPDQVSGIASRLAAAGFVVLTFDFRGFRRSEGLFSLANEVEDARNAASHLLRFKKVMKGWIGVYGASYGGAVAVLAAARDTRIGAVCIRAPVYDTLEFARSPLIQPAVEYILGNFPNVMHGLSNAETRERLLDGMVEDAKKLNPAAEIQQISPRPFLIVTGDADKEIKLDGVRRFYESAKQPKKLVVIEGADHELTNPKALKETNETVVAWFKQLKKHLA
jgi:alpha-beta hydrolase superfamily lysophospholipase